MRAVPVYELPMGTKINVGNVIHVNMATVKSVKHHKNMGTVSVEVIGDDGEEYTVRYLDGIQFGFDD